MSTVGIIYKCAQCSRDRRDLMPSYDDLNQYNLIFVVLSNTYQHRDSQQELSTSIKSGFFSELKSSNTRWRVLHYEGFGGKIDSNGMKTKQNTKVGIHNSYEYSTLVHINWTVK
ncbi:unnamed protein product [Lepeophtheirus salmonis]|uniref:(salmon louse) hypothetical protein n=1 Tax=Lepeophtheirus salmonis TaxID=72036 RepID=A0A7R8HBW2_LEPSM|nr:unnamed protein product [Lepeophtheirus salmonis]CAF2988840.1 unnamed protein product [Lepeophtheirus salmonis]